MGRSDERGTNHPDATWTVACVVWSATASGAVCTAQLWRHARATPFALAFQGGSTDGSMGRSRWAHSGQPLKPVRPSTCWRTVMTNCHATLHVVCHTSYCGRVRCGRRCAGALSCASRGLQLSGRAYNILTLKVLAGGWRCLRSTPPPSTHTHRLCWWVAVPALGLGDHDGRLAADAMGNVPTRTHVESSGARTVTRWHGHWGLVYGLSTPRSGHPTE